MTMLSVDIYFTVYRNNKFYPKSLKHTSFITWFDGSRIYHLLHQNSYHYYNSFASSVFGKFELFCDFSSSQGQKVFSNHVHFLL